MTFFRLHTMTMEKYANEFARLAAAISKAEHILLATHENPDEDGLGAMLAFARYLKLIGKEYTAFITGAAPARLSFLSGFDRLTSALPAVRADMLIAFDYGDFERLRISESDMPPLVAAIDHHPLRGTRKDIAIIDGAFSSSCEIAYHFFNANHIAISHDMATCIYTGIVADTGGFIHGNTSPEVFRIAARLKESGVDTELIAKRVLGFASVGAASVIGCALSRIAIDKEAGIMYSYLSSEDIARAHTAWDEVGALANIMNHIQATDKAVRCIALFKDKNDGAVSVSFRSDAEKDYNAEKLATAFGGGGHKYAAAAKIEGILQEAIAKVLAEAKRKNYGHVVK